MQPVIFSRRSIVHLNHEEHRIDGDEVRSVWVRTARELLHGRAYRHELANPNWWQRLVKQRYERGTYFEFAKVTLPQALEAFDKFLAEPKEYAIETAEGCRIDVLFKFGQREAFLDTWFSDGGIEDSFVPVSGLRMLIRTIYATHSDAEIARWLREHGRQADAKP